MNAKWVDGVKPPATGREDWFDTKAVGLGLRVSFKGTKTWFARYRTEAGSRERLTIGRYPVVSLAKARELATEAQLKAKRGASPSGERKADKAAVTFDQLADVYLENYAKAERADGRPQKLTWAEDERSLKKDLRGPWGHRKAKDIARRDIHEVLDAIRARGSGVQANRVLALISKVFNVGIDRGLVEHNPAHRVKRVTEEVARDRVLTEDEIRLVWAGFNALPLRPDGKGTSAEVERVAAMFKIRLLTAQRGGEVCLMRWCDIDLDQRVWTIPKGFTKTKANDHAVPLAPAVIQVLECLGRDDRSEWVFPSARTYGKPIMAVQKAADRVVESTGVDFRLHDLRRTAATMMTELGVPRLVVSKVLNHAEGGVTWKYDRNPYLDEKRDALERWATRLAEILTAKSDKVIQLRQPHPAKPTKEGKRQARRKRSAQA